MKERNRFDALAEELASEEVKPKPKRARDPMAGVVVMDDTVYRTSADRPKFPAPISETKKRAAINEKPRAFISVMGRPYTVIEWSLSSVEGSNRDYEGTATRYRTSYEVKLKLLGAVPSADLLQDPSITFALVAIDGDTQCMSLQVREVEVVVKSTDRYTKVIAYGTEVS